MILSPGDMQQCCQNQGLLLASSGLRPGTVLNILHSTGQCPQKRIIQIETSIELRLRNHDVI